MNPKAWAVVLILATGCAQSKPPEPSESATPPLRALGQNIDTEQPANDEPIGFEIRHRLSTEAPGESAGIVINVSDGVVTLTGFAPNQAALWRIEAIVRSVQGVKEVRNQLIVRTNAPLP